MFKGSLFSFPGKFYMFTECTPLEPETKAAYGAGAEAYSSSFGIS